jgi:hypothetical protein
MKTEQKQTDIYNYDSPEFSREQKLLNSIDSEERMAERRSELYKKNLQKQILNE